MEKVEILVEELSMKEFLIIVLPRILSPHWQFNKNYFIRVFSGKSDLHKNIPRKMLVYQNDKQKTGVVIIQDQDSNDCKKLKKDLLSLANTNGNCPLLVRIVCRELESWYLGDLCAIEQAYPQFDANKYQNKSKFRNPDKLNAYDELQKILHEFQKVSGAKAIAPHISLDNNTSESFQQTLNGIKNFFDPS